MAELEKVRDVAYTVTSLEQEVLPSFAVPSQETGEPLFLLTPLEEGGEQDDIEDYEASEELLTEEYTERSSLYCSEKMPSETSCNVKKEQSISLDSILVEEASYLGEQGVPLKQEWVLTDVKQEAEQVAAKIKQEHIVATMKQEQAALSVLSDLLASPRAVPRPVAPPIAPNPFMHLFNDRRQGQVREPLVSIPAARVVTHASDTEI